MATTPRIPSLFAVGTVLIIPQFSPTALLSTYIPFVFFPLNSIVPLFIAFEPLPEANIPIPSSRATFIVPSFIIVPLEVAIPIPYSGTGVADKLLPLTVIVFPAAFLAVPPSIA